MTEQKKNSKIKEIKDSAEEKFSKHMIECDLHHPKRITLAAQFKKQHEDLQDFRTLESVDARVALLTFACILNPEHHNYWPILAKEISRYKSTDISTALIHKVDNYLEEIPLYKRKAEYEASFYKEYIHNDAIYVDLEKFNKADSKVEVIKTPSSNAKSMLAPGQTLEEVAIKWKDRAITQDEKKRKKNAFDLMQELRLQDSISENKLDDFSLAQIEVCIAYIDRKDKSYTQSAINAVNKDFNEDQLNTLVEMITYGRERVLPDTPFYEGAEKMLAAVQRRYEALTKDN